MKHKGLQKLLSKEMDRKAFLAHVGASALMIAGVSGIIKAITDPKSKKAVSGYGSSSYGGRGGKS